MAETNPTKTEVVNIHAAFIAVQGELEPLIKDEKGNYHEYATLSAVMKVIRPVLKKNGLGYMTVFDKIDQPEPILINRLFNAAGEQIEQVYPVVCVQRNDPQKFGGAITYARRYSTMAFFGLAPEDDDGEAASERPKTLNSQPTKPKDNKPATTPAAPKSEETVPCEVPGCRNTVRKVAETQNRENHEGHAVCQFHHNNGNWKVAVEKGLNPDTGEYGQAPEGVDQDMHDAAEAALQELMNPSVKTNPDGSTEPVAD